MRKSEDLIYEKNVKRRNLGMWLLPLPVISEQAPVHIQLARLPDTVASEIYLHTVADLRRITICPPAADADWAERTAGRRAAVGELKAANEALAVAMAAVRPKPLCL